MHLLYNTKILLRIFIGHWHFLYKKILQIGGDEKVRLLVNKDTDIVIEGFPRSGNTYFVLMFQGMAKRDFKIAHHIHLTCQIKKAIEHDIPAIVLIRHPKDSISSLVVRDPRISIYTAIIWYLFFHNHVLKYKQKLIIKRFDKFIEDDRQIVLDAFHKKIIKVDKEELFQRISKINLKDRNTDNKDASLTESKPNKEKKAVKRKVKADIETNAGFLMRKCEEIYSKLLADV